VLDVVVRRPESPSTRPPLLFVHGFWHGAWTWDEFFLPYFAQRGYACYAPNLRAHGASPSDRPLRWTSIGEYVDDVAQTVARLPAEPVLIGASAGGFVVQKYLEERSAAGAILVASIPPTGAWRAMLHIARHHPRVFLQANTTLSLAPLVATPELARAHLFTAATPEEQVRGCQQRLQDDSFRAFLDLVALDLVRTSRVTRVPMLVLGGADDALVSPAQVRRTADAYAADLEIFPSMGHDLMLDQQWQRVAERMDTWLEHTLPA
jgi:pimeloyl-ACP methyl ester carboxylesterase